MFVFLALMFFLFLRLWSLSNNRLILIREESTRKGKGQLRKGVFEVCDKENLCV